MRHMSKLLAPVVAGTLVLFGLSASGAEADSGGTVAQLIGFHQMVVDSSAGYIFLSGSDGIAVTDLSGNTITTLDTGNQVAGLALSSDPSDSSKDTLYAALTAGNASTSTNSDSIDVIDVSTIKASSPTESYYALGNGDVPYGLAFQGGELWVSYTDSGGSAGIGSFDPTSDTFTAASADDWTAAPDLAADPQAGGTTLVAVQPGSEAVAATYTIASGALSPSAPQPAPLGQCSGEIQLAVVPGGADFIAACGASANEYSVSDLSAGPTYATGSDAPEGTAVDADGTVAVGSSSAIYVYGAAAAGGTPDNIFNPGGSASLAAGGLGWEDTPDGSQLIAVADSGGSYSLQVFSQPTLTRSALTLTAPSTAAVGSPVTLSGSLTLGNGAALPSDTTVAITRTGPDGTPAALSSVPPGPNGSFTFTDTTKPPLGKYTYTATAKYAGSATIAPAAASQTVTVGPLATSLSITTGATTFNYDATIQVVAHLGATYTNRTVSIYAQWDGYKSKTLLKTGQVSSSGELTVSYTAPHSTTFSAVFTGDAHYAAKTVTHDIGIRANTTLSMAGYYGNKNVGGTTYRMYHQSGYLYVTVAVGPNKPGECAQIEVQENYSGAWHANELTACAALDGSSRLYGYLTINNGDLGYEYRVRADYVRSSSDTSNLSNDSGWQYIMPEK